MLAAARYRAELRLPLAERLERARARRRCPECGGRVDAHGRNPYSARYCSDACKMRAYRRRRYDRGAVNRAVVTACTDPDLELFDKAGA